MDTLSREATRFSIRVNSLKERIAPIEQDLSFKSTAYLRKASLFMKAKRSQNLFPF